MFPSMLKSRYNMLALFIQELGFQKSTLYVLAWAQLHSSVSKGGVGEKRYKTVSLFWSWIWDKT